MGNQKVSAMTAITRANSASDDLIHLVTDTTATGNKSITLNELFKKPSTSKSTTYTLTASDAYVICTTSSAAFTLTLPTAVGLAGKQYIIQKISGATDFNILSIDGAGSETVGGETTIKLFGAGESVTIISDGTNWSILNWSESELMDWTMTSNITTSAAVGKITFKNGFMHVKSGHMLVTGTGAATPATVTLPGTLTFNTAKLSNGTDISNDGATNLSGMTTWFESGVAWRFIQAAYYSTTTFAFFMSTQRLGLNQLSTGDGIQFPCLTAPVA